MRNLFIEGIPGSGKSTLVRKLVQRLKGYTAYYEGDISPVELAWCSYMDEQQYQATLVRFPELTKEIERYTAREGSRRIVAYTRILAESRRFYEYMEQYEIYNGRLPLEEFQQVVLNRYEHYHGEGNIFECSLFQNNIDNMLLFFELSEEDILAFYRKIYKRLDSDRCQVLYLYTDDIAADLDQIRRERVDDQGQEIWYRMMMQYFEESPYGRQHHMQSEEDLIRYYERRISLERRILREVFVDHALELPRAAYDIESLMETIQ